MALECQLGLSAEGILKSNKSIANAKTFISIVMYNLGISAQWLPDLPASNSQGKLTWFTGPALMKCPEEF
jgi:hypothetical protein